MIAEERSSSIDKVFALVIGLLVYYEIFLLSTNGVVQSLGRSVAEEAEYSQSLCVYCVHGAEQGSFGVKRLARVGAERRGYVKRSVLYECVRTGVPSRVASCLKGGAKSARGEGGCVGLSLDELLSRKFHNYLAASHGRDKGVVLFGGNTRQWLEPVGIVGCALLNSPVLHCVGDHVCNGRVDGSARRYGLGKRLIDLFGKPFSHYLVVKDHAAEYFGNFVGHKNTSI